MKKRWSLILLGSISLALGLGICGSKNYSTKVDASVGSYSTDASTYYNGITATSGKQLAAQLHDLITSTHQTYTTYDDNGKNLYQQKTDQYYENGSKVNGYIYEFYSGVKWPNAWDSDAGSTTGGYNREHCWCQSNSKPTGSNTQLWGTTGGGSDMHHIRPVESRLNSTRNNHPYGEVTNRDSYKSYAKYGTNQTYALGGYTNNDADIFEPLDSKKGDVARIILYVYLHYNSYTNSTLFGSYGTTNGESKYSGYFTSNLLPLTNTTSQTTEAKALEMLLRWNSNDPVDDIERRRNDQVATYQGNRNPFIDNSSYADAIWGTTGITSISKTNASLTTGGTTTISAISSNSGTISWSTSNSNVCSISSNTSSSGSNITLTAGSVGTATITASITISGTTYSKTCAVTVSAPKTLSYITISDYQTEFTVGDSFSFGGTVTAVYTDASTALVTGLATFTGYDMSTLGTQTVTVSYTEGTTETETYSITVTASGGGGGESGNFSGTYNYGNQGTGTGNTWSLTDCSDQTSYWLCPDSGNTSVALIPGIFSGKTITSDVVITIKSGTYNSGTNPSSSTFGIYTSGACTSQVTATQTGTLPTSKTYTDTIYTVSLANSSGFSDDLAIKIIKPGKQIRLVSIIVEFDYETSGSVSPTLSSISLNTENVQTEFTVGATFNYDGLLVTANYSDNSTESLDSFDVSSPDMSTAGTKTVTVSYEGLTATYDITVNESSASLTLVSISISGQKTSFTVGDTFDFGGTVTATYSDDSTSDVTSLALFSGYNMSSSGVQTVTVSYTYEGDTETETYQITVNESSQGDETAIVTFDFEDSTAHRTSGSNSYAAGGNTYNENEVSIKTTYGDCVTTGQPISGTANFLGRVAKNTTNSPTLTIGGIELTDYYVTKVVFETKGPATCSWSFSYSDGGSTYTALGSTSAFATTAEEKTVEFGSNGVKVSNLYLKWTITVSSSTGSDRNAQLDDITVYGYYQEPTPFTLVSSTENLKTGDEIIFAANKSGTYYAPASLTTGLLSSEINYSSSTLSVTSEFMTLKIFLNNGLYSFVNSEGKYLKSVGSGSTVTFENSITSYSSFALTYENGVLKIQAQHSYTYKYLRFVNANNWFSFQTSNSNYNSPLIFKKSSQVQADSWASTFLSDTASCNKVNWSTLATSYGDLSDSVKSEFVNCEANESTDYNLRSQAMARYEYMLSDPRFNDGLTAFVTGRSVSPARPNLVPLVFNKENNSIAIIIITSLVSISTVGGYFFLKSRKKEEL